MILDKRIQTNISLCKKSNGTKINLQRAAQNIVELQRGLTGKRSLVGNAYMQQAASLQAYLLYYWPVSYAQTVAALQREPRFFEAVKKIADQGAARPIRILDLGSGPAPACCALADLAQGRGEQNLRFEFFLYDSSGDALSLGKRILESAFPKTARVETNVCNFENASKPKNDATGTGSKTKNAAAFLGGKKYDFIIASHSLNELWKNEKKRGEKVEAFLSAVCDQLEDGGLLLLTEPALLATSRALIEARDWLVQNGMRVVSPCLCPQAPCPALENPNATCHYQFDWEMPQIVADLARLAGLNRADVKMTYFVFEKSAYDSLGQDSNLLQAQEAAGPDFRLANASALVVSEPMLNKAGRIRYVLCDGKSRFTLSAKNGDPLASAQSFFALKRYDKIAIQNAQVRSQNGEPLSLGIGEDTRIFID
ncbi:MAG: methyltransferase domain-containing protein [Treponema sp.]|nr:methyltransferase domain-containing protein [Treponema sp.]